MTAAKNSKTKRVQWSAPYCGGQHLKGLKRGYQVTATHRGQWSEVFALAPGSAFTSVREETCHGDGAIEAALALGEQMARELNAFEQAAEVSR